MGGYLWKILKYIGFFHLRQFVNIEMSLMSDAVSMFNKVLSDSFYRLQGLQFCSNFVSNL